MALCTRCKRHEARPGFKLCAKCTAHKANYRKSVRARLAAGKLLESDCRELGKAPPMTKKDQQYIQGVLEKVQAIHEKRGTTGEAWMSAEAKRRISIGVVLEWVNSGDVTWDQLV